MSHFSPNQGSPETIALQRQLELAHYAQDALHAENERLRARYEELQQVLAGIEQAKERDRKRKREEEVWEGEWRKLKRGLEWVRDREVEKVPAVLFPSKHAVVSSAGRPPRSSFRDSPSISPKQRLIIDPEEASQGHSLDSGSSEDEDSMSDYSDAPQKPKKTQGPQYRQDEILRRENNAILLKSYGMPLLPVILHDVRSVLIFTKTKHAKLLTSYAPFPHHHQKLTQGAITALTFSKELSFALLSSLVLESACRILETMVRRVQAAIAG
ncbi:hypothetical protein IAR50_002569 [Cryptococcus sp. DSM 104548]